MRRQGSCHDNMLCVFCTSEYNSDLLLMLALAKFGCGHDAVGVACTLSSLRRLSSDYYLQPGTSISKACATVGYSLQNPSKPAHIPVLANRGRKAENTTSCRLGPQFRLSLAGRPFYACPPSFKSLRRLSGIIYPRSRQSRPACRSMWSRLLQNVSASTSPFV